ncbi:peptidase [Pseudoalteromonas lipolytica SCSIO 04301]|uniref:M14 family metallopeptidase n=1 Tax=Pseudoalteromonas TaxID=53246 RepID=UPI00044755E9|nr:MULTISPECIES: M14 family metallocarboxypeptidase [Pseudoalteromonas]EWH07375.1 peptidase [Pseudoalteromonas lipolytica SCSIO 04301]MCC9662540.1 M14 family metallocarboxypeptidase [Pseudoalteromonas sp. MB41]QLJ09500.1 M14 family metallocarboxypeptidase [Pseudoalteromonas sp. JSTW]QPL44088.1 M14 family metallocarboxypeptidase [Pseudoalteromonas sp. A41-2]
MNYPIGTPGKPWNDADKKAWLELQSVKRSYQDDVVSQLDALSAHFDIEQYGALSYDTENYPLYILKSKHWQADKPCVLITGGVHGYETSGVHGALAFAKTKAADYLEHFNILVAPCISPWGYETINRWNPNATDPNRSFYKNSPAEESAAIMSFLAKHDIAPLVHVDLHETTDTDNSEFRPALAARDAKTHDNWNIPDGFYLVADSERPQDAFQTAIIKAVEKVTHIAPSDENNQLIGVVQTQFGVINYEAKKLGLCMGLTNAKYVTTTEVYPDSPHANDTICINAQVASITGALDYVVNN